MYEGVCVCVFGSACVTLNLTARSTKCLRNQPPPPPNTKSQQLQNMMLVFHDRISTLEKALKKANSSKSSLKGDVENSPPSNKRKKQQR
jgi:hypothetical protein